MNGIIMLSAAMLAFAAKRGSRAGLARPDGSWREATL